MCHHIGLGSTNLVDKFLFCLKIGHKNFDSRMRIFLSNRFNSLDPMFGTQIRQIITIDRGNNNVSQLHQFNRLSHIFRLSRIQCQWASGPRIAELTRPSANVAANHKSSRPPIPTLAHIWTTPAGTNGVQTMRFHNLFRLGKTLGFAEFYFQPIGFFYMR